MEAKMPWTLACIAGSGVAGKWMMMTCRQGGRLCMCRWDLKWDQRKVILKCKLAQQGVSLQGFCSSLSTSWFCVCFVPAIKLLTG